MLHGFLGVGKTTFAKRLEEEQRALRFSHDEWMTRLYGDNPPAEHFQDYARRVFQAMEGVWPRCLELGTNIILDFGLWSRSERMHIRALILRHGGEAVLYRLACPDDVAWTRIAQRNTRLSGSLYISPETYQALRARFEPLEMDEPCIEVESQGISRTFVKGST